MCNLCAETREMWKKSGAWFYKSLPKYILPERRAIGKKNNMEAARTLQVSKHHILSVVNSTRLLTKQNMLRTNDDLNLAAILESL